MLGKVVHTLIPEQTWFSTNEKKNSKLYTLLCACPLSFSLGHIMKQSSLNANITISFSEIKLLLAYKKKVQTQNLIFEVKIGK